MQMINEELLNNIRKLIVDGFSHKEIGEKLSRTRSSIEHICTRNKIKSPKYHGLSKHPLAFILKGIIQRCTNKKLWQYKNYGGRGICVCEGFRNTKFFILWCLKRGWKKNLDCDRINNNLHYSCGQCNECVNKNWEENLRFVSEKENQNNRRNNKLITAFGETKTIAQWSDDPRCKCDGNCLWKRLNRGWTAEDAILKPSKKEQLCE